MLLLTRFARSAAIKHCQKKPRLVNDQKPYKTPCVSVENELHSNIKITNANLNLGSNASFAFFPYNEASQPLMCSIMNLPLVLEHAVKPSGLAHDVGYHSRNILSDIRKLSILALIIRLGS